MDRIRSIRLVLWVVLAANWGVATIKVIIGFATNSTAVTADGLHSFIDGASNVIGLFAMYFASAPADDNHPYGHQKYEALAALSVGGMIAFTVVELGRMAIECIVEQRQPLVSTVALMMMVATLVVNVAVSITERRAGRRLKSAILIADAGHTASDSLVTVAVIVAMVLTRFGVKGADGIVALVVLVFVAAAGWAIVKQAAGILSDAVQVDPAAVTHSCANVPEVRGVHGIRSRGMAGAVYVDLKIEVDRAISLERAHDIASQVEAAIIADNSDVVDVVVHVEPATVA